MTSLLNQVEEYEDKNNNSILKNKSTIQSHKNNFFTSKNNFDILENQLKDKKL